MIAKADERLRRGPGSAPRHAAPSTDRWLGPHAGALLLLAILVPLHRWWSAQILLLPLLLVAPGVILLRALRIPGQAVRSFPAYVPCGSIIVLFGSGLAVDLGGPLVGVAEPLRAAPLLVGLEVTCVALLAASRNAPQNVSIPWRSLAPRPLAFACMLIVPLTAAVGALRLNNGHGNGVAMLAVCSLIVLLVVTAACSDRLGIASLEIVLYAAGLALVWSDSLRGDPLYGFDIATEYQRFQQTITAGIWYTAHPNDPYGAMLSITVMPAELHALSGISGLMIFKITYPVIYAFFPVAVFGFARRILSRRWAFVAAAFTIGQYAFTEMAGFARQEIALVFFAAFIAAMTDSQIPRRLQCTFVALLGVATALSHYSTTYVAVTIVGFTLALQWVVSWFRQIPRISGAMVVGFLAAVAGAVIWYIPVTNSDSHVLEVAQTVEAQGLNLLPNRVPGGSLLSAYLQGNSKTPIQASHYEQLIHNSYLQDRPYIKSFPDAGNLQYELHNSPVPEPRVKWYLGYDTLNLGLLISEQLANVLAAFGALLLVLRRKASVLARQVGLLTLATTLLLTVLRFSGTLAVAYGQERAQLQGLVLLSVGMCWCLQSLAGAGKARQRIVRTVTITGLALVLANTTYLVGAVLGGLTSVNLANSGPAFEYLYMTAPEIASAQWLLQNAQPEQLIYTDEYGQVRLDMLTTRQSGIFLDLTPLTLNQQAWIYATRTNTVDKRAFALYQEHLATYVFPASYLSNNYDLVYTDGSSEVFHH